MIGDEIPTVHVFSARTGEFLGSVPKGQEQSILARNAAQPVRTPGIEAERQKALALENQARWALEQPWYVQGDVANAAGMAMTAHALKCVVSLPALDSGDLGKYGPLGQAPRSAAPIKVVVGSTEFTIREEISCTA